MAKIHNIDLKNEPFEKDEMYIDWQKHIDLAKDMNSPIYNYIKDYVDLFNDSMTKGNEAIKKLLPVKAIYLNDMDSKNVFWLGDEFKLIDLECLGYSNPYLSVRNSNGIVFLFIEEPDYVAPVWPEKTGKQQKQMHFDFQVDDVYVAVEKSNITGSY